MTKTGKRIQREYGRVVGRVLRGEYTKRGMTQADLAESAGEPVGTVRNTLAGSAPMTIERFELYCAAIGVDPGEVLREAMSTYGGIARLRDEISGRNLDDGQGVGGARQDLDAEEWSADPTDDPTKRNVELAAMEGTRKGDQPYAE